jgi:DNA-directed RNA polymerase subunit RPC12/RpoP
MQCTNCGAELQAGATVCPSCSQRVVLTKESVAPVKRARRPVGTHGAHERPWWQLPSMIALIVVALAAAGWVVSMVLNTTTNTPDGAATRMMTAYGAYDAQGILDNVTHSSLTPADVSAFRKQVTDGKATNKGLPWVKSVKIVKTTIDPADKNSATVQLTEQILDPAKGTYSTRNETLAVVKQNGTWLVRLF